MRDFLFVASNLAITAGYVFLSFAVIPRVTIKLNRTRLGGIGFFLTCGLHHLHDVFDYLFAAHEQIREVFSALTMLFIDVPQAVFVWMFVTGLYIEFVKWGPWGNGEADIPSPARR